MDLELREFSADELRVDDGESGPVIRASIKFNTLSVPLGFFMRFREKIAPTAFDQELNDESREVLAFWNHNTDMPLGRRTRSTLAISKTDTLFKAEITPPDTTWGQDAVKSIRRRDVQGLSFGFRVRPEGEKWEEDDEKNLIRTLTNVELQEVSPTPMPAYPKSSATVRSMEAVWERYQAENEGRNALVAAQIADRQRRDRLSRQFLRRITRGGK